MQAYEPYCCVAAGHAGRGDHQGKLKPVHASYPLAQAAAAHQTLEASEHIGKIILLTEP